MQLDYVLITLSATAHSMQLLASRNQTVDTVHVALPLAYAINVASFDRCQWATLNMQIFVLLTLHLSIILDNAQLDTQLLYFTIRLL